MSKSKKIIISVFCVAVVFVAIIIAIVILNPNDSESTVNFGESTPVNVENYDLLLCKTKAEVESFVEKHEYELFYEDDWTYIYSVRLFDGLADFRILFDSQNKVSRIIAESVLYEVEYPIEEPTDSNGDLIEYVTHDFTDEEKQQIDTCFSDYKFCFEQIVGCDDLPYYDVINRNIDAGVDSKPLTDEELFYEGYTIREYSVRDADGTIWLLDFSASDYYTYASIIKFVDTSGFEGFIPIIDMFKTTEMESESY